MSAGWVVEGGFQTQLQVYSAVDEEGKQEPGKQAVAEAYTLYTYRVHSTAHGLETDSPSASSTSPAASVSAFDGRVADYSLTSISFGHLAPSQRVLSH